ncbi:ribonuclease H-like domain-containing protein [Tanacetum coccineum]
MSNLKKWLSNESLVIPMKELRLDDKLNFVEEPVEIMDHEKVLHWAGCLTTRRSTSGCCVFLGKNLFSWSSKRKPTLSHSSAGAEYRGVANADAETCWLRNLLRELHTLLSSATLVYCDNVSAVYLSSNPVQHQRTKHIEIDIYFVHGLVAAGKLEFFMSLRDIRTFSLKVCLPHCLKSFTPVCVGICPSIN